MVHSVSEPDSVNCPGKRAKSCDARLVDNGSFVIRQERSTPMVF